MRVGTCHFKTSPPASSLSSSPSGQAGRIRQLFHTLPTYSPPSVSPTHGDQIEVSMVTPGAQGPGLVSPRKT